VAQNKVEDFFLYIYCVVSVQLGITINHTHPGKDVLYR